MSKTDRDVVLSIGTYHKWRRRVLAALDKKGLRPYADLDSPGNDIKTQVKFSQARGVP